MSSTDSINSGPKDSNTPPNENNEGIEKSSTAENSNMTANADVLLALQEQIKEKEAKYVYLYAESETYKKRVQKEKDDLRKFGWENVARELLQVLDNLDRALEHVPQGTDSALVNGLNMVNRQFKSTLDKFGVQTIPAVGQVFDPNLHEAMGQEPSDLPSGTVSKEHQKGYTFHGRLLRPSRVMLSAGSTTGNN